MLNMENERNLNAVHCPFCGALMGWNSDFMASETGHLDPDTPAECDVMVKYYSCPDCGASGEFVEKLPED